MFNNIKIIIGFISLLALNGCAGALGTHQNTQQELDCLRTTGNSSCTKPVTYKRATPSKEDRRTRYSDESVISSTYSGLKNTSSSTSNKTQIKFLKNAKVIKAITADGKSVLLDENGKWVFDKNTGKTKGFSFRKTNWGMSKAQVRKSETGKNLAGGKDLAYRIKVAGLDALLFYVFVDNKLVTAHYDFTNKHSNKNSYLTDYSSIQKILKKKYGNPDSDDTNWLNDLYKDEYQSRGMALAVGHLSKFSEWKNTDTKILLGIYGDNFEISHNVSYYSVKLQGLATAKSEESDAEGF